MIDMSTTAVEYFRGLIESQGVAGLGIRLRAVAPGTPQGDCQLEFCEPGDRRGDEWEIECDGFTLFVEADSAEFLDGANIDFSKDSTGGQLSIKAPKLRGTPPDADASIVERVRYLIDAEVNPKLASHGGHVTLREITADGIVVLQFGGGCHGCGMSEVTLKNGIEKTLREKIPEVTGVRDITDHETGSKPYYSR
ncbi:MAG TPA: NfuA family Fe-S biogenesis protein [Dokdonella sp.]|uniref:NfuA family Fe-S biogenesis protein n=1 Tax=Dokdonella sp. TaxID=2291710 RepID=UPI002D7F112B|nr:NfuA family Fe-S biogenesis protein [Dokdonella sp.]HET9032467.1 NfuA family Fe-S biogenesis protein [Dokdonella sp.]